MLLQLAVFFVDLIARLVDDVISDLDDEYFV